MTKDTRHLAVAILASAVVAAACTQPARIETTSTGDVAARARQ